MACDGDGQGVLVPVVDGACTAVAAHGDMAPDASLRAVRLDVYRLGGIVVFGWRRLLFGLCGGGACLAVEIALGGNGRFGVVHRDKLQIDGVGETVDHDFHAAVLSGVGGASVAAILAGAEDGDGGDGDDDVG